MFHSLKRGTGEAILILLANPDLDFSKQIIRACLKNYVYDSQAEGSRANYLYEAISLSKRKSFIKKTILTAFATASYENWDSSQLFDLAKHFAMAGDPEAKKQCYFVYRKRALAHNEWDGEDAIIELDGLAGLLFVAATKGEKMVSDPDWIEDGMVLDDFQDKNPSINIYEEIEKRAAENVFLKTYITGVKADNARIRIFPKKPVSYESVLEKINSNAIVPLTPKGAKELSETDVHNLATAFLKETDRIRLEKFMRVFSIVKYPFDYHAILTLAKSKNMQSDRLVEYAVRALSFFSGNDIREFALEKLTPAKTVSPYLDLLVSNYADGDEKILESIATNCRNGNQAHELVWSFIRIYEANKTPRCKTPLELLYDKLTCGLHREDIVLLLLENNVLSEKIRREIKYDSYLPIRSILA